MRFTVLVALAIVWVGCADPCRPENLCLFTRPVALRAVDDVLAVADIDADGAADIVSLGAASVAWRRGPGLPVWPPPEVWTLPARGEGLALGDVDGDGRTDLVTAIPSRGSLVWLRGAAAGWEEAAIELKGDAELRRLLTLDMNGDGADEVVASERDVGRIHLWKGGPQGPSLAEHASIGGEAIALAAGNFRGDAGRELAAAIPSRGVVELFELAPTGQLQRASTAVVSAFPQSLAAGDLDADGHDDLAVIDGLDGTLWVGFGDGAGWREQKIWQLPDTPQEVLLRHHAGIHELAIVGADGYGLTIFDPLRGQIRIQAMTDDPGQIAVGDLVAGSSDEVVYTGDPMHLLKESPGFRARPLWSVHASGLRGAIAVADLDDDAATELIVADLDALALVVFAASSGMELARLPRPGKPTGLVGIQRGDGGTDLAWWEHGGEDEPPRLGMLTYTPGSGLLELASQTGDETILDVAAADLDADGWDDLVVTVDREGGGQALVLMPRLPDAAWGEVTRVLDGEWIDDVVVARLDDDGDDDLWVLGGGKTWVIHSGDDGPLESEANSWEGRRVAFLAADLDGDMQADLVACDSAGVSVGYGLGGGEIEPPIRIWKGDCERFSVCDLDSDNYVDLVPHLIVEREIPGSPRGAIEVLRSDLFGWESTGAFLDALEVAHAATRCSDGALLRGSNGPRGITAHEVVSGPALGDVELRRSYESRQVLAADLNGDGLDDLLSNDARTLVVALADGEGGFHKTQRFDGPVGDGQYIAKLMPAELDGRPGVELLVWLEQADSDAEWRVVWSLREGAVAATGALDTGFSIVGDFNGDGRDELLVTGDSARLVKVGSDGTSLETLALDPGAFFGATTMRVADMTGDGREDLLLSRSPGSGPVDVFVAIDGGFAAPQVWPVQANLEEVGVGHADGDSALDLAFIAQDHLMIAHGDGRGAMDAVDQLAEVIGASVRGAPLIDDLDSDGVAEAILLVVSPAELQVIRLDGKGSLSAPWSLESGDSADAVISMRITAEERAWAVLDRHGAQIVRVGREGK